MKEPGIHLFFIPFIGGMILSHVKISELGFWVASAIAVFITVLVVNLFFHLLDRYWTRKP